MIRRRWAGAVGEVFRRAHQSPGNGGERSHAMPVSEGVVDLGDDSVGVVGCRSVDKIIVLEERPDIRVRQRVESKRLLYLRVEAVRRYHIAGEGGAKVLEIAGRDRQVRVVSRVGRRRRRVVDGQRVPRLVHRPRKVAGAFSNRRNGMQRGAEDALPDALVGQTEKRGVLLRVPREGYGSANIESKLIAAQRRFALAVLLHLVRDGIQNVVAEVLIDAPVPHESSAMPLSERRRRTAGAHPELAGQSLELLGRAGQRIRLPGWRLALIVSVRQGAGGREYKSQPQEHERLAPF